jgi:hypothetical protein
MVSESAPALGTFDSSSASFPRQRHTFFPISVHQCPSMSISGLKIPASREATQPAIETRSEFR